MDRRDKPVVWLHPVTGEYQIPMHKEDPMPMRLSVRGFVRKEFDSYFEHRSWCSKVGLVNHSVEDVRNDGDVLGKNRWDY